MLILLAAAFLAVQDPGSELDCANASNTLEINDCATKDVATEQARLETYLAASVGVLRDEAKTPEAATTVVTELQASQKAWQAYADSACSTVYTRWQSGTIRNLMALSCRRRLTQDRSHSLWADYLVSLGGEEPVLPEPLFTP